MILLGIGRSKQEAFLVRKLFKKVCKVLDEMFTTLETMPKERANLLVGLGFGSVLLAVCCALFNGITGQGSFFICLARYSWSIFCFWGSLALLAAAIYLLIRFVRWFRIFVRNNAKD